MSKINDILITAAENLVYGWPNLSIDDAISYIMKESDKPLKYWASYKPFDTVNPRILNIYKMNGIPDGRYLTGITKNIYDSSIIEILIKNGDEPGELIIYIMLREEIFNNCGIIF